MKPYRESDSFDLMVTAQGELQASVRQLPSRVRLVFPAGTSLLRRVSTKGLASRELTAALTLRAEETLPEPIEDYFIDHWNIPPEHCGLAALPRAALVAARKRVADAGSAVNGLVIPELCPPDGPQAAVVFWALDTEVLGCYWLGGVLVDWLTVPALLPMQMLIEQFNAIMLRAPEAVYVNSVEGTFRDLVSAVVTIWPKAEIVSMHEWDVLVRKQRLRPGPEFKTFLREAEQQQAGVAELWKLGLAAGAAFVGLWFFSYGNIRYLEQQVERLQHQTSLLKVQATRSEKIAARSGEALRDIRELRQMTVERPGALAMLKVLADTLPPRVKLQNVVIERSGMTAIEGVAESELDVTRLLERLSDTSEFQRPNLAFAQRETDKGETANPAVGGDGSSPPPAAGPVPNTTSDGGRTSGAVRFRLEAHLSQPLLTLPGTEEGETPAAAAPTTGAEET